MDKIKLLELNICNSGCDCGVNFRLGMSKELVGSVLNLLDRLYGIESMLLPSTEDESNEPKESASYSDNGGGLKMDLKTKEAVKHIKTAIKSLQEAQDLLPKKEAKSIERCEDKLAEFCNMQLDKDMQEALKQGTNPVSYSKESGEVDNEV